MRLSRGRSMPEIFVPTLVRHVPTSRSSSGHLQSPSPSLAAYFRGDLRGAQALLGTLRIEHSPQSDDRRDEPCEQDVLPNFERQRRNQENGESRQRRKGNFPEVAEPVGQTSRRRG